MKNLQEKSACISKIQMMKEQCEQPWNKTQNVPFACSVL